MELKLAPDGLLPMPAVMALLSLAVLLALLLTLLLCVCKKTSKDSDPELRDVSPVATDAEKSNSNKASGVELTSVQVTEGNGTVTAVADNGRPLSHERALPELPTLSAGAPPNEDEEEEDIEDHYDVIPKRNQPSKKAATPKMDANPSQLHHHAYAKVTGEPDSDLTYAGIASDSSYSAVTSSGTTNCKQPLYAHVDSDGDGSSAAGKPEDPPADAEEEVTYALIDENKRKSKTLAPVPAGPSQSSDPGNASYAFVPPPVPTKNFELEEVLTPPENQDPSSSPGLPPRNSLNGDAAVNGDGVDGVDGTGASGPDSLTGIGPKRDPPYSHVTARESLDNLRKRHSKELKEAASRAQHDSTYASVDYDEIKSPGAAEVPQTTATIERLSITSELYAEIASGEASCRSSTYAHVGDVGRMLSVAPAPPSVETLRQLSHPVQEEDAPDPGYSCIKSRRRPHSTYAATGTAGNDTGQPSGHQAADNDTKQPSGRRSPVYAVVDKSKQNKRKTIHVVENSVRQSQHSTATPSHSIETAPVYSLVNKGSNRPCDNLAILRSQAQVEGEGGGEESSDPEYQTIGNTKFQAEDNDPNYDSVRDSMFGQNLDTNLNFEVDDPNYETVPGAGGCLWQSGTAQEITDSNTNQSQPRRIREHIYQDIDEAKREAAAQPLL